MALRRGSRVSFFCAGIGEVRQPRPRHDRDAPEQPLEDAAHGGGAEQQGLLAAAQMQDAVGEDMAALEIAGELHLVDRDEGGVGLARHRLDRADRVFRAGRHDLLLAGDQRNFRSADLLADAGVDLARKQSQRQSDDAALVRHHALDREVGLAGVGRPEHGRHVAPGKQQGLGVFRLDGHGGLRRPFWHLSPADGVSRRPAQAPSGGRHLQEFSTRTQAEMCGTDAWVNGGNEFWNESATNH